MTIVNVIEEQNLSKYLVITQQKDPSTLITTRVLITDNANNRINLINVERGPQGDIGPVGPQGLPGKDGIVFDILPIGSGGTNNTEFTNDKIIYFDGSKLTSSIYSVDELINSQNAITGIIAGTGLSKIDNGKNITINTNLGDGLTLSNNTIVIDNTIARKSEISLGTVLPGLVPINKGGTNNNNFNNNSLIYFDGSKLTSFPLSTGNIVTSGSTISVIAGSGLIGGGSVNIPGGSIVINIPQSSDVAVLDNSIELSITGVAGTYTKITTDTKGRVVSGTQLTQSDVLAALGYVPWNPTNDGHTSGLDADLLDGKDGSYYLNFNNLTGTISTGILPNIVSPGSYAKVTINSKGLVISGTGISTQDVVDALGYYPVSKSGDTIYGNLDITGDLSVGDSFTLKDNLPEFGYNNYGLLPNAPRGFSFTYGDISRRTGILAYYPGNNELKLITNIYGTGVTDLDGSNSSETNYNGEVDGGDASSIYLMGNIGGDQSTVLLQHIADRRYVSLTSNQIISGIKLFDNYLTIKKYLYIENDSHGGPPFYIGNNSVLVDNLNSDFLDGQHGYYYRDAINITGVLDYQNVTVTNLSGTKNYLSKFDNRTDNPSRTVTDSIAFQSGNNLIVVENGSLSVGTTNKTNNNTECLVVGDQNKIYSDNSLVVGSNNIASGTNSIVFNTSSKTLKPDSLAMGKHGTTWIENQLSIGAMEELSTFPPIRRIGHAQHSTAALGYMGSSRNYSSMSPSINIPVNKTLLYNIDLLFTKFGSSGVASFNFSSGIVKNTKNTAGEQVINIKSPTKKEIYNDSQIRDYTYNIEISQNKVNKNQTLAVTKPSIRANNPEIQNFKNVYRIKPDMSEISGNFFKTFDGNILLNMHKPISSGWFFQGSDPSTINIKSYYHGMVLGSYVNITYVTGSIDTPISPNNTSGVKVLYINDEHNFTVENLDTNGNLGNSGLVYVTKKRSYDCSYAREKAIFSRDMVEYTHSRSNNNISNIFTRANSLINFLSTGNPPTDYDPYIEFSTATNSFSGILTSGSNTITSIYPSQEFNLISGMFLTAYSPINDTIIYTGIINSLTNDSIVMNNIFNSSVISTGVLLVYSGTLPPSFNYHKTSIILNGSGYIAERLFEPTNSGIYFTGIAYVYPNYGEAIITSVTSIPANIANDEIIFSNFLTHSTGMRPVNNNYITSGCSPNTFKIISKHLMPDSGRACVGSSIVTLDRDHGYLSTSTLNKVTQQIPLFFSAPETYSAKDNLEHTYTSTNNIDRLPKDNILSIIGVSGHQILVNDNKYQLLREINKLPLYNNISTSYYYKEKISDSYYYLIVDSRKQYFLPNDKILAYFPDTVFSLSGIGFRVSGVSTIPPYSGMHVFQLAENNDALISGIIDNEIIKLSGNVSYITIQDGYVSSPLNGFYFHSYGSGSEFWQRDSYGKYIDPPLTGFFVTNYSDKLCNSGTFCINISGISDITHIQPEQKLFFDFIDTSSPQLTGVFSVNDKLSPNILTINVPYDPIYEKSSGLVYVIESQENIKTDKNPNINNQFKTAAVSDSMEISDKTLSSFNYYNNRWKHGIFFNNSGLSVPTGYLLTTVQVNHEQTQVTKDDANIIVFSPLDMSFDVSYSGLNMSSYELMQPMPYSNTLSANSLVYFNVTTNGGAGLWSNNINDCAPRVSILGLKEYEIIDRTFDQATQQWTIKIQTTTPKEAIDTKILKFIVADESGKEIKDFKITNNIPLTIDRIENIEYAFNDANQYWKILFDVYGGTLPYNVNVNFGSVPAYYDVIPFEVPYSTLPSHYTFLIKGTGNYSLYNTGVYPVEITVQDGSSPMLITKNTGNFIISSGEENKNYRPSLRTYYSSTINRNSSSTDTNIINMFLPCRSIPPLDTFNIGFTNLNNLPLSKVTKSYYYGIDLYRCTVDIKVNNFTNTNVYGLTITGSVAQPSGNTIQLYDINDNLNITVYDPIAVDTYKLVEPLLFDIDSPWTMNLDIVNGANFIPSQNNRQLRLYIGNTPNIGQYYLSSNNSINYNLGYKYSYGSVNETSRHIAGLTGTIDKFGRYAVSTGVQSLYYYIEDYTSYTTGIINVMITGGIDLINFHRYKYATPNNGFDTNFDVEGLTYGPADSYTKPSIKSNQSDRNDPLINLTEIHNKYDPHTQVWEYFYSGDPITEKWDAIVELNNSTLDIKVKGLSTDKIYVAGRFESIETDNVLFVEKPFKIKNVKPATINDKITEGDAWKITFDTEGGLEDPNYPPLIKLTNTPGESCTGYNPADDLNIQLCAKPPVWNASLKEWSFEFNGPELCLVGSTQVSIEAQDVMVFLENGQKVLDNPLSISNSGTLIIYESGEAHPRPSIDNISDLNLYPLCTSYYGSGGYYINVREYCPRPTGISGIVFWGSLPPGISFNNPRYPFDLYEPPYNNLSGGYIYFNGMATTFADGANYPYTGHVGVIDAVGASGKIDIIFKDASKPIEVSPTDMTIYFDKPGYVYTPENGTRIIQNEDQNVLRPPPTPFSMKCLSKLPHSKCVYSTGQYSIFQQNDSYQLSVTTNKSDKINLNGNVYVQFTGFLDNGSVYPLSDANGVYKVVNKINDNNIILSGTPGTLSLSYIYNYTDGSKQNGNIEILDVTDNIKNKSLGSVLTDYFIDETQPLNTTITSSTATTGLLGDGTLKIEDKDYGIYGRIKPVAYATTTGYPLSTTRLENFDIHIIPGEENNSSLYTIGLNNCYETGYLRVSGIVLPDFLISIPDPPPAQGSKYTTRTSNFGGTIITSFNSGLTINYPTATPSNQNGRSVSVDYSLKDEIYNTIFYTNSITTDSVGFAVLGFNLSNILNTPNDATIMSLNLKYNGDIFPTYKLNSIPSASSVVYWIHSGIGIDAFPPVYPIDNLNLVFPTGKTINTKFTFVGGNNTDVDYTGSPPLVTGYIQTKSTGAYYGTYSQPADSPNLTLTFNEDYGISNDDALYLQFLTFKDGATFTPSGTGVILSNNASNLIVSDFIDTNGKPERTGLFVATDLCQIYQDNTDLNIKFNSNISNMFISNTGIDLISSTDKSQSLLGYCLRYGVSDITDGIKISSVNSNIATISNLDYNYYSNLLSLNGIGLCHVRNIDLKEVLNFTQTQTDITTEKGLTTRTLTGIINNPFNTYTYRVITCENTVLPIFDNPSKTPKTYGKDYSLTTTTPPTILTPSNITGVSYIGIDDRWTFSFAVTGGYIPRSGEFLEVEIDDYIHTFSRSDIIYDSGIYITLNSRPGINWTEWPQNFVKLKVFDSIGTGIMNISLQAQ